MIRPKNIYYSIRRIDAKQQVKCVVDRNYVFRMKDQAILYKTMLEIINPQEEYVLDKCDKDDSVIDTTVSSL
jgi:hypothetical protein